jgi:hypothetical protein
MSLFASSLMGGRLQAWLLLAAAMGMTACADRQVQPAREAIARIEATLDTSGTAPVKYIPGEVRAVRDDLDALKRSFEREDYAGVLRDAPAVLAAAQALPREAAAREAELLQTLQREWTTLEPAVPATIAAMRSRVAWLAATGVLPDGVSREDLNRVARRVDDAQALWDRALAERSAQRLPEAVTLAHQARELLDRMAGELGAPAAPVE